MAAPLPARPTPASGFPFLPAHAPPEPQEAPSPQISLHRTSSWIGGFKCSCGAMAAKNCRTLSPEKYPKDRRWLHIQLGWGVGNAFRQGYSQAPEKKWASGWAGGRPPRADSAGGEQGRGPPMLRVATLEMRLGLIGRRPRLSGKLHEACLKSMNCRSLRVAAALTPRRDRSGRSSGFVPQNLQQGTAASQNGASADGRLLPTVPRACPLPRTTSLLRWRPIRDGV